MIPMELGRSISSEAVYMHIEATVKIIRSNSVGNISNMAI